MNKAEPTAVKRSRRTLIALVLVSVLPVAGAWFVFFTGIGMPASTVNAGQLLSKPMHIKQLLGESSPEWMQMNQKPLWRLLIPIGEKCPPACQQNLYTTRQVHIRLGEKSARVERVAINTGGESGRRLLADLEKEHPRLKQVHVNTQSWQQWLAETGTELNNSQEPYYLLMDQEGFVIMAYTDAQHGNELIKDLKRALKFSIDYQ